MKNTITLETIETLTQTPQRAHIREDECIGCTKCIPACPVDAIMGTGKQLHTVLITECIGCELCVAPCPVDCIDMLPLPEAQHLPVIAYQRHLAKQQRLLLLSSQKKTTQTLSAREQLQAEIQASVARARQKRINIK